MPSRTHWMLTQSLGLPKFDAVAKSDFISLLTRRAAANFTQIRYTAFMLDMDHLPNSFRRAIPLLVEIETRYGLTQYMNSCKLTKFRLPKHLRRSKNPVYFYQGRG
jgi:hypothetical protein